MGMPGQGTGTLNVVWSNAPTGPAGGGAHGPCGTIGAWMNGTAGACGSTVAGVNTGATGGFTSSGFAFFVQAPQQPPAFFEQQSEQHLQADSLTFFERALAVAAGARLGDVTGGLAAGSTRSWLRRRSSPCPWCSKRWFPSSHGALALAAARPIRNRDGGRRSRHRSAPLAVAAQHRCPCSRHWFASSRGLRPSRRGAGGGGVDGYLAANATTPGDLRHDGLAASATFLAAGAGIGLGTAAGFRAAAGIGLFAAGAGIGLGAAVAARIGFLAAAVDGLGVGAGIVDGAGASVGTGGRCLFDIATIDAAIAGVAAIFLVALVIAVRSAFSPHEDRRCREQDDGRRQAVSVDHGTPPSPSNHTGGTITQAVSPSTHVG